MIYLTHTFSIKLPVYVYIIYEQIYPAPALYGDADMHYTVFLLDSLEVLLKSHITGLLEQQYLPVTSRIPS